MNLTLRPRRRCPHPLLEPLEGRALLAAIGAIDPSFGTRGEVAIPLVPAGVVPNVGSVTDLSALDSSGRIVLGGSYSLSGTTDYVIERLDADGSPDSTFGTAGRVSIPVSTVVGAAGGAASSLLVEADGSIIEAGSLGNGFGAIRFTSAGVLDTSFGTNGVVTLPATIGNNFAISSINAATFTADGHFLLVGSASNSTAPPVTSETFVARFDANGTLDTTFGTAGIASIPVILNGYENSTPSGVVIQPSGRIVVSAVAINGVKIGGTPVYPNQEIPVVLGLTSSGALDTTFGPALSAGIVVLPEALSPSAPDPGSDSVYLAQRANGGLILAVYDQVSATQSVSDLVALTVDGSIDTTNFNSLGTASIAGLEPTGVAVDGAGNIIVPGVIDDYYPNSAVPSISTSHFAVARFDSIGEPDTTFGQIATPGVTTFPSSLPEVIPHLNGSGSGNELNNVLFNAAGQLILTGSTAPLVAQLQQAPSFAVIRAFAAPTVTQAVAQPPADLAGTGTTDYAVYLTGPGAFAYLPATAGAAGKVDPFGIAGVGQTIPAVGDYTGSGHAQVAAYLTASGTYAIQPTATSPGLLMQFGMAGLGNTIPAPGDYEGLGKDDVAVYLPTLGDFAILPSNGSAARLVPFGTKGIGQSIPAPADYYGTGQDDIAVYLAAQGAFAVQDPTGKTNGEVVPFGMPGVGKSIPVPGDYDGSGHVEFAVYIPSLGAFFYRPYGTTGASDVEVAIGTPGVGELPAVGDYDGVGHDEFAVYDPTRGLFTYRPANGGNDLIVSYYFGTANGGSVPVATPAGSLPVLSGSGGSVAGFRPGLTTSGSTGSGSTASITVTKASALPSGPTLASMRVARALVNQGDDDSSDLTP